MEDGAGRSPMKLRVNGATASAVIRARAAHTKVRRDSCLGSCDTIEEGCVNHHNQHESDFSPSSADTRGARRSLPSELLSRLLSRMSGLSQRGASLDHPGSPRAEMARALRLVREDLEVHDGDWTRPGFQALLVYRFGVWRMSIRSKLFRAPFSVGSRALFAAVRNLYGIELPYTASIGRRVIFEHQHGIVVHGSTVIGDDCIIRQGVTLGIRRLDRLTEAPVLGRAVNVGAGAKILGAVYIGDHAQIGANAVVLENIPPRTLAVGIPAHVVSLSREARRASRRELPAASGTELPRPSGAPAGSPASSRAGSNGSSSNGAASSRSSALAGNRPN